ncbi:MAG: hypothetical protein RBT63_06580, partial [Bdellovibrionales bacterium]|nr:hypothetical protein [Bdellovibrionales bacterium]
CREQTAKQASVNREARYRRLKNAAPNSLHAALDELRDRAYEFHDRLMKRSYEVTSRVSERSELDQIRAQMDSEFLSLVEATLNERLKNQIEDVVTGRRLLLLPPDIEAATFTLKRQPASQAFMKRELAKLEAHMKQTMASIASADHEDVDRKFKSEFAAAHEAWKRYRKSNEAFGERVTSATGRSVASVKTAGDLWFHIEGIYYFEQLRDREIGRPQVPVENEALTEHVASQEAFGPVRD